MTTPDPLGDNTVRALQQQLGWALVGDSGVSSFVRHSRTLVADLDPDDPRRRELEARAAGLKAVATRHATRTIQTCREAIATISVTSTYWAP